MSETYTLNILHRPDINDGIYERFNDLEQPQESSALVYSTTMKSMINITIRVLKTI